MARQLCDRRSGSDDTLFSAQSRYIFCYVEISYDIYSGNPEGTSAPDPTHECFHSSLYAGHVQARDLEVCKASEQSSFSEAVRA